MESGAAAASGGNGWVSRYIESRLGSDKSRGRLGCDEACATGGLMVASGDAEGNGGRKSEAAPIEGGLVAAV